MSMISSALLNPKFAIGLAAWLCELRVRGTSVLSIPKFVQSLPGCVTNCGSGPLGRRNRRGLRSCARRKQQALIEQSDSDQDQAEPDEGQRAEDSGQARHVVQEHF